MQLHVLQHCAGSASAMLEHYLLVIIQNISLNCQIRQLINTSRTHKAEKHENKKAQAFKAQAWIYYDFTFNFY
jgi:hypothetical protein